jgi:SAM-dependent methyltransferase
MSAPGSEMESEFDTLAAWTEEAVAALGRDHAVPAGCRGSGSPAALDWIADRIGLSADVPFLDSGAGVGGPAAWLAQERGVRPVCAEPMPSAALACRRLFGLPTVVAWSQALPFADASFGAAWSLGVLDTTDDQRQVLLEQRRVLRAGAGLGLLVLTAEGAPAGPLPEGNAFLPLTELRALMDRCSLPVQDVVAADELPAPPADWSRRADAVEDEIRARHAGSAAWREAQEQSGRIGHLLSQGGLRTLLLVARAR